MPLSVKHLLGIEDLTVDDINLILNTSQSFKEISARPIKKVPTLRGKSVINLFYEPSTRTRASFEIAAKRLGADAVNFSVATSSVTKGESLIDTGNNLQSMNPDIIVVRHSAAGAPHLLAQYSKYASIVNAGDGMHEHPTQALLDALTILDHKKKIADLKVAIVGDIAHSRVARSNALLLGKMGAEVWVCGPPTLIPVEFEQYGVTVTYHMKEALQGADVVMMLRTQRERQQEVFYPSVKEYFALYGLERKKMKWPKKSAIVMHPGPINRGVEIDPELADGEYSVILEQVTNGVAVRMAVLFLLLGTSEESEQ
ncbi:aspartate carbamoyltransferase catalytic subunit [Acidobacteria bacterium AH-259-G07]|nr:aspartate carbamoyltransferase catalytic subunit [Acidobacteria bacterium AH-259-G07]